MMNSPEKPEVKKVQWCPVPECGNYVPSGRQLCKKHDEWMKFLLWAADKIKVVDSRKMPDGINVFGTENVR